MKRLLLALVAVLISLPAYASSTLYTNSSAVGIGTSSPTAGVALDVGSNTNSMLLPIGTTGQRPSTGVAGMLRYNSTNNIPEFYTTSWLPVPLTASSPLAINSTTGNITCSTCNTSAANVNSVSGDGTFYTNSASTGAVTLTLGNATAYSVWGNNTSSSATPAYTTSPKLSGAITDTQSIGATSTDGLVLTDPTAAASGNQEWSPRIRWTGQGWKTNTTAGSQETDAIAEIQPVQGTANPSFNWVLSGQINGGGYGALLTVPSGGNLNLNSGVYEINGTQLAASNLQNGVNGSGSIVLTISPTLTTPNIGAATGTSLAVTGNITTSGGEVGIDTTSPVNALDVSGGVAIGTSYAGTYTAPTNGLIVQGDVGIGTSSPSNPLSVDGIIQSLSGGFKFPDGTTQTTASTNNSSIKSVHVQTFTSSGTYTPTTGMAYAVVEMVGGGGKGGASYAGGGGGAGAYIKALLTAAQIGSSQSVTIGAASSGSGGGTTSVGSLLSCTGGADGATGGPNQNAGGAGGSPTTTTGTAVVTMTGQNGGYGNRGNADQFDLGGLGGSNPMGMGGAQIMQSSSSTINGNSGTGYGSGGSGGVGTGSGTGGPATAGYVAITEYCTQ